MLKVDMTCVCCGRHKRDTMASLDSKAKFKCSCRDKQIEDENKKLKSQIEAVRLIYNELIDFIEEHISGEFDRKHKQKIQFVLDINKRFNKI